MAGTVNAALLHRLLKDPYYALAAPKSTGREYFHADYVEASGLTIEDEAATLTELTAVTVADQIHSCELVVVSGGGVHNPALMAALQRHLPGRVTTSAELGVDPDAKEAYMFALLGYLSATGQPGTVAAGGGRTTTGASAPRILGDFTPGREPLQLPEPAEPVRRLTWQPSGN